MWGGVDGLPIQRSGGGGYQVFLRCPDPGRNKKLARKKDKKTLIETKAEGGYVLMPPSLHPSGNRYAWMIGGVDSIPTVEQERADFLIEAARRHDESKDNLDGLVDYSAAPWTGEVTPIIERCIKYLGNIDDSVAFSDGDHALFRAGCEIARFALRGGEAWAAMHWYNEKKCSPKWPTGRLNYKIDQGWAVCAKSGQIGKHLQGDKQPPTDEEAGRRSSSGGGKASSSATAATASAAAPAPEPDPAPIPLDQPLTPKLPNGVFLHAMGDMIDAVSASTEAPKELCVCFALPVVAATVQDKFRVRTKPDHSEPLCIWMLAPLQSGNRKSSVCGKVSDPLSDIDRRRHAKVQQDIVVATSIRKTIEARILKLRSDATKGGGNPGYLDPIAQQIADLELTLPEIPRLPHLFTQDVTPEHLGTMMSDNNECMTLLSDEGGMFDMMAGRYSNGNANLDIYLQSQSGAKVLVHRGSRPEVRLDNPALSIGVSPQRDKLVRIAENPVFLERGMLGRFLFMMPASPLGYRTLDGPPIPPAVTEGWHSLVNALAKIPNNRGTIRHELFFSPESQQLWSEFEKRMEPTMREGGKLEHYTNWASKLPGQVARVAGLLHCADNFSAVENLREIQADTMKRAIVFGEYLIDQALSAFSLMYTDPSMGAARDLWRIIEKNKWQTFTVRDAWHPLRGKYGKVAGVDGGLDALIDRAFIFEIAAADDRDKRKAGRKPSKKFRVNQRIVSGW